MKKEKQNKTLLIQGDKISIVNSSGAIETGEFHRYGATRNKSLAFFGGSIRFVDEQSLIKIN